MLRATTMAIGLVFLTAVLTVPVAPAQAATSTKWVVGTRVPSPLGSLAKNRWAGTAPSVWSPSSLKRCGRNTARIESGALVKLYGDYVYVQDKCRDGRSATAMVSWHDNGNFYKRVCRNRSGYGTRARCNFNWTENWKTVKSLTAGSYNGGTGYKHFGWGTGQYFNEQGGTY